ncbi:MAG: hypothetical protein IKU11_07750 [Clostridia bacterium]|nr:hypothetical protein [Clostridia bacterium]
MKTVLLSGDSIRRGYDAAVKKSLEGIAEVYYPADNSRFAAYTLRYIHEFKDLVPEKHVDVLHWNAGLWDCLRLFGEDPHTPLDMYAYYIDRICKRIEKTFPESKVIFATSTSVESEKMHPDFKRYNEEIEAYNARAVEIVKGYGHEINDLYTVSKTLPTEAHSDAVHYYTPMGTEVFTKQVLCHLTKALELPEVPAYKEEIYVMKPVGI